MSSKIIERVLQDIGDPDILSKLASLSQPDLNTLLLELFRTRTQNGTPAEMMRAYRSNRFSAPSLLNPAAYRRLEAELLEEAEKQGIKGILLSPAAPLGSCSVFGCVSQNNVVSASRGTELLSDPTNMLALILSDDIKNGNIDNSVPVHYCASARITRAAKFTGKRSFSHFGVFCIASSGKDRGSYTCEKDMLAGHLSYYRNVLNGRFNAKLSAVIEKRGGYTDGDGFFSCMSEVIKAEFPDIPVTADKAHSDNAYYKGINFKLFMHIGEDIINICDGGFVDWTQKLLGNRKERCLISGIGLDRLLML